jgi:hypothetical protein
MAFFFNRDTKVFMEWSYDGATANTALFEIPVLDGFSFSQGTNTSEVTLNEAANSTGYSKRGRAMFTDSFAPAEWSFSTYMRPTLSTSGTAGASGNHAGGSNEVFAVEGPLWASMSANTYDRAIGSSGTGDFANNAATYEPKHFDWGNSNQVTLGTFNMYFVLGAAKDNTTGVYETGQDGVTVYKLVDCSTGTASIDFDIDGIAQIAWSGQAKNIDEVLAINTGTSASTYANGDALAVTTTLGLIRQGVDSTSNFIRQKLTNLALTFDISDATGTVNNSALDVAADGTTDTDYGSNITLTGGNITIENNLSYLTPETLGQVNLPLGHVMGTRTVSGNFTCYLNDTANGSRDLFERLQESRGVITNNFDLKFSIGGSSESNHCNVHVANAHLELPTHSFEDVISVDVNFHGLSTDLSSSTAADATNEVAVTYAAG